MVEGKNSTRHCWLPKNIAEVIRNINIGFDADADGKIEPTESEIQDRNWRADLKRWFKAFNSDEKKHSVARICLGTAQFGMNYGIANQNGIMSQNQVNEIVHFSVSNGIMTFDTAQSYGDAEFKLGNYLKKGELEEIKIITKLDPSLACCDFKVIIKTPYCKNLKLLNVKKIYGFFRP